jgi:gamma-glutamyltranspeptidase/glutathione hydrolase
MNRSLARLLKIVLLIAALGLVLPASGALGAKPVQTTKHPTATGTGGAVATVDHDASQVGMQVLREGGNAVDAAVAAAATLGLTEPYSCGIGGGGLMVVYDADDGSVSTIDSRETAPAAFESDSFIDPATEQPIPFDERVTSGLGVGVPGTIRGWEQALGEFGSRPLSELLQPSIRLAARGFVVDQTYRQQTLDNLARFEDFTSTPEIGAATGIAFLPDETVQAAAEPTRRGGGSALVENPAP